MIEPKQGIPAEQFTLRNTSGKDVRFTGWLLAEVSNHKSGEDKHGADAWKLAKPQRWKERAVYRSTGGRTICHRLGRSNMIGEVDRGEVLVVDDGISLDTGISEPVLLPPKETMEQQIIAFFGHDPLAKHLLGQLGIDDVEMIDEQAATPAQEGPSSAAPEFTPRDRSYIIVCRDAGVQHPANDMDDSRTYSAIETVELCLHSAMHPNTLRAQVVADGERIAVCALHSVYAKDGERIVRRGDVLNVERRCISVVWR